MKKYIKISIIIIIILIIVELVINAFTNKKSSTYNIFDGNKRYKIEQNYKKIANNNIFSFTVKLKKDTYNFSYNKNFSKKTQIIKNIKYYKKNNLECILPKYSDNSISDLYCLLDKKQVSYSYLEQTNNKDLKDIVKQIKNKKLNKLHSDNSLLVKYKNISYYKNNIDKNITYSIWYYKGLYSINNDNDKYQKILKKDKYENTLSMLVDKYYIVFNTDNMNHKLFYKELFIYDIEDNKLSTIKLNKELSIDTYINGVYDNKLYITDVDALVQYSINPKNKKVEEIGSIDNGFYTVNNNNLVPGKLKNNIFSTTITNNNIGKLYKTNSIYKSLNSYYFISDDGFYQIINNNYKNPIKLFNFPSIKEVKIKDGYISFIVDDTIYLYSDGVGLRPVIKDSELKYNYKNIYDFWKK